MSDRSLGCTGRTSTLSPWSVRLIVRTTQAKDGKSRGKERDLRLRLQEVGKYKEGPRPPFAVFGQESKEQLAFLPYHFSSSFCKFRCLVRPGPESPVSSPGCKHKVRPRRGSSNGLVSRRTKPHPHPRTSESEERGDPLTAFTQQPVSRGSRGLGGVTSEIPAVKVSVEHGPSPEAL